MNQFTDSALSPLSDEEPAAWSEARRAALKRHTEFETPILDAEAWKHDTLKGFGLDAFEPGVEDVAFEGADAVREVGGIVATLPEAIADERVLGALLDADWPDSEAFFTTLATAFAQRGAVVLVPRGKVIQEPIVLQRTLPEQGKAVFPLTLVILEENAEATVIDRAKSELGEAASLAVHPTYLSVGDASQLSYLAIQDYAGDVWHFAPTRAKIGKEATVRTMIASLGGRHSRCVTESVLDGRGASTEMLGMYFGDEEQFIDHRTLQHHAAPNTTSELYYKGALAGKARSVYAGLVKIEHEATDCDAKQANRNLLLSDTARADASPFLEILTSEVVGATHGVSVGRPDDEVLWYMQSRGLDYADARRLFVIGFFQEVIDRVRVAAVRERLEGFVEAELEQLI